MPSPQEQDQPVETGLSEAATPPKSDPIQFADPISEAEQTAVVSDEPTITEAQMNALQAEAARDDTKRDFTLKVLEARAKKDEPPAPPPPLAPRMADQTNAEIEAGRKMNAHHAALQSRRPVHVPTQADGKSTAVFRPGDYVPDQKKGQGYVQGRNL
jgi:hypothetical protein